MQLSVCLFTIFILSSITLSATTIWGSIIDEKKNTVPGANVFIEGSYDGTSSDADGTFSFHTTLTGAHKLVIQCMGMEPFSTEINCGKDSIKVNAQLYEKVDELEEVTISAGSFEASDKKKAVVLSPLDIVTTASSQADIYGALTCLPGATAAPGNGQLVVRGGEASETKTFIDGLLMNKPYSESLPNLPTRGKFIPFLFDGMMFSSGAYAAEFGGALSAVVNLRTKNEISKTESQIMLMSVGTQVNHQHKWDKSSVYVSGGYTELAPYYTIFPNSRNWTNAPSTINGIAQYRLQPAKNGLLKVFASASRSEIGMIHNDFQTGKDVELNLNSDNYYLNTNYTQTIQTKLKLFAGVSYSNDNNKLSIPETFSSSKKEELTHAKSYLNYAFAKNSSLQMGYEMIHNSVEYDTAYSSTLSQRETSVTRHSVFLQNRIRVNRSLVCQAGLRVSVRDNNALLPRISLAYKVTKHHLLSIATGKYEQEPADLSRSGLDISTAWHTVANYQYEQNDRIFRVESYAKEYKNLPLQTSNNDGKTVYSSDGYGYARGIDLFWRDKRTIKHFDYWLSYSFIQSERKYGNYREAAQPDFIPSHSASIVAKQFVDKWNSMYGVSYSYSSGLPYDNPNSNRFMSDRAMDVHDVSVNYTYLFLLFGKDAFFHLSANNLLLRETAYSYEYKSEPNSEGLYENRPVKTDKHPFIIAVLGVTF